MSDKDAGTPRVYIIRHGETEWTLSGQYTGRTDIPLTSRGELQVQSSGNIVIGPGKLIDPSKVARVFISPRSRALRTYDLLFSGKDEQLVKSKKTAVTDRIAEWDYGLYEGLLTKEIRSGRKARGLDVNGEWDIWRDGCEEGDTPEKVTARLDSLIQEIHSIQSPNMHGENHADVVIVAHGHILRAFTKRWLNYDLSQPFSMMLEPGGVGILSYQHHNIDEPAICIGIGFPSKA